MSRIIALTVATLLGWAVDCLAAEDLVVTSPDARVRLRIMPDQGHLRYAVTFTDKPVVEPSEIALTLDGVDLCEDAEAMGVQRYAVDDTYPWRGVHHLAFDRGIGVKQSLRNRETGTRYTLDARAYNEGVAFRIIVPAEAGDRPRVVDEATSFVLPAGSVVWSHDLAGHYEGVH